MTTATTYPTTLLTSPLARLVAAPDWIAPFAPRVAKPSELRKLPDLPELTVVRAEGLDALLRRKAFLSVLSEKMARTPAPAKIVFLLEEEGAARQTPLLVKLFKLFVRPFDLEVAAGRKAAPTAVFEAAAKIEATRDREAPAADPLADLKGVLAATADLRSASGKLSAERVAEVFGLSKAELAGLLHRSRQSVWKTPDADSLQEPLRPFERVARLRAALSAGDFRKWLHLANRELGNRTPIDWIREERAPAVADLVEDVLTGSPS